MISITDSQTVLVPRPLKRGLGRSTLAGLALLVFAAAGVCRAQNAQVEKFFAEAKEKEAQAQKLRSDAGVFTQAAADYEAAAAAADREAQIFNVRALQLLKDANKERAFSLRLAARKDWADAHRKLVGARNTEVKAAQFRHNAEELLKAAGQVKDQPSIAGALENDARAQTAEAQSLQQTAAAEKAEAEKLDQRAELSWKQAETADPETHRQVAPRPARPELRPGMQH